MECFYEFKEIINILFILLNMLRFINFKNVVWGLGMGDWGLGIGDGDWAQSPIPNPQSPIPKFTLNYQNIFKLFLIN